MTNILALTVASTQRWKDCVILQPRVVEVRSVSLRLVSPPNKVRYQAIEASTTVPWYVVAMIHERESGQDFATQLGQGDPLNKVSRHIPRGMGPYFDRASDPPGKDAFYRCAVDTLINTPPFAARWRDWSVGGLLVLLELYNGTGYEDYHHEASPYIWGATNQEQRGKYSMDGVFNPRLWDTQIGCAAMLKKMMELDSTIKPEGA